MSKEEPRTSILYFIVAGIRRQVGFPCLDFTREDAAMSIERYGELYLDRTEAASTRREYMEHSLLVLSLGVPEC